MRAAGLAAVQAVVRMRAVGALAVEQAPGQAGRRSFHKRQIQRRFRDRTMGKFHHPPMGWQSSVELVEARPE
jgi:hypothetical protein